MPPIGLRDLAAFAVPPADQTAGQMSLHRFAGGLRELAQLNQQRDLELQRQAQQAELQRQRLAAEEAQAHAQRQAAIAEENRKRAESRRTNAQKVYGEVYQQLSQPGGAARVERRLPELQAHGVKWQALPDGTSYGFVYQPEGGAAEQWGSLDLGKMTTEDKAATERMLGAAARAQTGRTPTEVASAGREAVLAEPSLAGKEGLAAFESATNQRQGDLAAMERTRVQAAATRAAQATKSASHGELPEVDPVNLQRATQQRNQYVRERVVATRPMRANIALARQAITEMQSGNPLSQNTALIGRLKAAFGSRSSDKELQFTLSEGGLLVRLQNAFTRAASGTLSEEYRADFVEAAQRMLALDEQRLIAEARSLDESVSADPSIRAWVGPEYADMMGRSASQQILGGGAPEEGPPAPEGYDADAEADRLLEGP